MSDDTSEYGVTRRASPSASEDDREGEVELASFLEPPSSDTQHDMMSYHIEASKRLTRIDQRNREKRRMLRLPPGWDEHKLKHAIKLGTGILLCLVGLVQITSRMHSARRERYQEWQASQPIVYNGFSLPPRTVEKATRYRQNETALIVNLHLGIMHSSTEYRDDVIYDDIVNDEDYICKTIGRSYYVNQQAPRFHCRIDIHQDQLHVVSGPNFPPKSPWRADETSDNIQAVRKFWHLIDWYNYDADVMENAVDGAATSDAGQAVVDSEPRLLADTNWQDPNLISILVMVDPMTRLLEDSWAFFERTFPTEDVPYIIKDHSVGSKPWLTFVQESPQNYVVQQLGQRHSDPIRIKPKVLVAQAKDLLKRFTFVLDSACLEQGVQQVADILEITVDDPLPDRNNATWTPSKSMPADVYRRLMQLNQLDIELYQWSKTISLVQC